MMNPKEPTTTEEDWKDIRANDERHIAYAMFLLQKALTVIQTHGNAHPTVHASLRDAAIHCEKARSYHTIEYREHLREIMS